MPSKIKAAPPSDLNHVTETNDPLQTKCTTFFLRMGSLQTMLTWSETDVFIDTNWYHWTCVVKRKWRFKAKLAEEEGGWPTDFKIPEAGVQRFDNTITRFTRPADGWYFSMPLSHRRVTHQRGTNQDEGMQKEANHAPNVTVTVSTHFSTLG